MAAFWQKIKCEQKAKALKKKQKQIDAYINRREELLFRLKLSKGSSSNNLEKDKCLRESVDDITRKLEELDVHVIQGIKLDFFDEKKHEIIARQEVDSMNYHNKILEIYSDAYEYEGEIIRKMHVMVGYVI